MNVQHQLKIWPEYFEKVVAGKKKFELRSTKDRKFEVGQIVKLEEYDPLIQQYSDRWIFAVITYVTHDPNELFLLPNVCAFSFDILQKIDDRLDEVYE